MEPVFRVGGLTQRKYEATPEGGQRGHPQTALIYATPRNEWSTHCIRTPRDRATVPVRTGCRVRCAQLNEGESWSDNEKDRPGGSLPLHLSTGRRSTNLGDWAGRRLAKVQRIIHKADPEMRRRVEWDGDSVFSHGGIVWQGEERATRTQSR